MTVYHTAPGILPRARKEIQLYSQRQNDAIQIAAIIAAIITMVFLCILWPLTAGAQTPTPTPDGMTCITPTPDGPQWCMIPPVAVTVTPSATVMPPPFVPTMTATPTVTPTVTPTPTATPLTLSPLPACVVEECVYMPIGRKP